MICALLVSPWANEQGNAVTVERYALPEPRLDAPNSPNKIGTAPKARWFAGVMRLVSRWADNERYEPGGTLRVLELGGQDVAWRERDLLELHL